MGKFKSISIMKQISIYFVLLFAFSSCGQTTNKSNVSAVIDTNKVTTPADTSNYAIIKFDIKDTWLFDKAKPTDISLSDIKEVEALLADCINKYNPEQQKHFDKINSEYPEAKIDKRGFIIDLSNYKRQYVAVINDKGEKEVWVNCFCVKFDYWKKEIVQVMDGGNCFFNLKINLTKKSYYDLSVNGMG
jgi:hypothetical protein